MIANEALNSGVITDIPSIPIQQNDSTIQLIGINKVIEYYANDEMATIVLTSGERITGLSLVKSIHGETALGRIEVAGEQVKSIRFNPERAEKFMQSGDDYGPYTFSQYYLLNLTSAADVTLITGTVLPLQRVAVIPMSHGCDTNWTPCKPYTDWYVDEEINLKYGEFATQLGLSEMESIRIRAETTPINFTIVLRNGETVEAALNDENDVTQAFIGTSEKGYTYFILLEAISSIAFKP